LLFRIEVFLKRSLPDLRGKALLRDIHDLGIVHVREVRVSDIYSLEGDLSPEELTRICLELWKSLASLGALLYFGIIRV